MQKSTVKNLTVTSLLIAIGIIIPMVSPLKIVIPPASYTLASHVPIFIAMFISPRTSVAVSIGCAFGFLLGGFMPTIVFRALSHVVFAYIGAKYLEKKDYKLTGSQLLLFSLVIGIIHAIGELLVVVLLFFGNTDTNVYGDNFISSIMLLVGLGTIAHSMIDFKISTYIRSFLIKQKLLTP
ncbi:MAG: hypothetical protein RR425_04460 [Erysipelotrichales bacterium]